MNAPAAMLDHINASIGGPDWYEGEAPAVKRHAAQALRNAEHQHRHYRHGSPFFRHLDTELAFHALQEIRT